MILNACGIRLYLISFQMTGPTFRHLAAAGITGA